MCDLQNYATAAFHRKSTVALDSSDFKFAATTLNAWAAKKRHLVKSAHHAKSPKKNSQTDPSCPIDMALVDFSQYSTFCTDGLASGDTPDRSDLCGDENENENNDLDENEDENDDKDDV